MHMRVLAASRTQGGCGAGFTQPEVGVGLTMAGMPSRQGPWRWKGEKEILPGAPPVDSAATWGGLAAADMARRHRLTKTLKHKEGTWARYHAWPLHLRSM